MHWSLFQIEVEVYTHIEYTSTVVLTNACPSECFCYFRTVCTFFPCVLSLHFFHSSEWDSDMSFCQVRSFFSRCFGIVLRAVKSKLHQFAKYSQLIVIHNVYSSMIGAEMRVYMWNEWVCNVHKGIVAMVKESLVADWLMISTSKNSMP